MRLRFPETVGGLMQFANPGEFTDDCPATWVVKLVSHTPTNARISSNNDRRTVLGKTSQFPCKSGLIPTISMPDILGWLLTRLPKSVEDSCGRAVYGLSREKTRTIEYPIAV